MPLLTRSARRNRSRATVLSLSDLTGGEASIYPISKWPIKYSELLQNCWVNDRNNIAKVPGYSKTNSTTVSTVLDSGHEFLKTDGTSILLASGEGKIFKFDVGAGEFGAAVKSGLSATPINYTTFSDNCIVCNGVDAPLKTTDGSTYVSLGAGFPVTAFKAHVHKGRVWFLERTNKMRASFTALNDISTIQGYYDFQYILKKGDELVDIFTYIDLLVFVFKRHIVIYSGNTPADSVNPDDIDFAIVQVIEGVGGIKDNTIQGLGDDYPFLSPDGVKTFKQVVTSGNLNLNDMSELIDPDLLLSLASMTNADSAHYQKLGWYLLKIDSTIRVFDYVKKTWFRIVGADCNGMFTTASGTLYFLGNGFMYQYDPGNVWDFAGTDPVFWWKSGWLRLSKAGLRCSPKLIELLAYPQEAVTLQMSLLFDRNTPLSLNYYDVDISPGDITYIDSESDFDAIDPFDETAFETFKTMLHGRGKFLQLQFKNTSDKQIELSDITLQIVEGGSL